MIPYGRQHITDDDVDAVVAVLRSDWLTQGPAIPAFENALRAYCAAGHAVAMNSATSALHIACLALGLREGDWLWTTPNTFLASAYAGLYCGANVDFVDIDPMSRNLSVDALAAKLVCAEHDGVLPRILVPVHFSGQPCDMKAVHELGQRYGFRIVEDAAHAIGATYCGDRIGACRFSDVTVFSFHPVKVMTTIEGGAAVTNDAELAEHMRRLRSHGVTRDPSAMVGPVDGPWYYEAQELGWNYRMTDVQASLGTSQLTRVDASIVRRRALADRYDRLLDGSGLILPWRDPDASSAWHLYAVEWDERASGLTRRQAFERLRAAGIGVQVHYIPVHLQPIFRERGFRPGQYPAAEAYYARTLSLPLFSSLSEADQDRVVDAISVISPAQRISA